MLIFILSASACAWGQSLTETLSVKYQPLISSLYRVNMHTEGVQLYRVATLASKSSEADKPALDNQHLNVQYNNLF